MTPVQSAILYALSEQIRELENSVAGATPAETPGLHAELDAVAALHARCERSYAPQTLH